MGTHARSPVTDTGYSRRPRTVTRGGGASVVVGGRESRAHGEGGQRASTPSESEQRSVDSDHQASAWLLSVQRRLYQWSKANPNQTYRELWNWVSDPRNLRCAWRRVASNRGKRTPGVDRVVQSAVKQIVEPIFEAGFWHVSYGFRPGRGCHGALEHIRMTMRPRATAHDGRRGTTPYQWVIEETSRAASTGSITTGSWNRVRIRLADRKVTRLLCQFLKAGALSEEQFLRTDAGTPRVASSHRCWPTSRCTPGSARGDRKPTSRKARTGADRLLNRSIGIQ